MYRTTEKELEDEARKQNKAIHFFRKIQFPAYCRGCGKFDVNNFSNDLCRSCYANWMRQRRKWKSRDSLEEVTGQYKERALKVYGKKPHCNSCGVRSFMPPLPSRIEAPHPRPDNIIVIHHINGNRKDNSIRNLEPLCSFCHKNGHMKKSKKLSTATLD